ncbi:hypothetical protein FRB95_008674 [Tulasnella sp. JGI-2019a]|nr:hypothetical protein FRB95_008674 [Tulasnella sp. JGI-2019a]
MGLTVNTGARTLKPRSRVKVRSIVVLIKDVPCCCDGVEGAPTPLPAHRPSSKTVMVATCRQSEVTFSISYNEQSDSDRVRANDERPAKKKARAKLLLNTDNVESKLTDLGDADYEETQKRKANAVKPKKRDPKKLMAEFLTTLPLDIVFYIFGQLEPLDLLRLARSTRTFRRYLMSKTSLSVWKLARANVRWGVPDCPSDQSEPQWANLIFTNDCMFCGQLGKLVDWALRLRGCSWCINRNLIDRAKALRVFRDTESIDDVLELLPHSTKNGSALSWFYVNQDIDNMVVTVKDWKDQVLTDTPEAMARYEAFKAERKVDVAKILRNGEDCLAWSLDRSRLRSNDDTRIKAERVRVITERLLEAGHDHRDIEEILWEPLVDKAAEITDARWRTLSTRLTKLVTEARQTRLEEERHILIADRREVGIQAVTQYKKVHSLMDHSLAPPVGEVLLSPLFENVIQQDGDAQVTPQDFDVAIAGLPNWIQDWKRSKMTELLRIVADGGGPPLPDTSSDANFGVLRLAKTFFRCRRLHTDNNIHTVDHIGRHICIKRQHYFFNDSEAVGLNFECLVYNANTSYIVEQLIALAGLNPDTATTVDMDELNARFYCQNCPGGATLARSWRNCARHVDEHPPSEFVGWTRLSVSDTAKIIFLENTDPKSPEGRIKCALCTDGSRHIKPTKLPAHLEAKHKITSPGPHHYTIDPLIEPRLKALPATIPVVPHGLVKEYIVTDDYSPWRD